MNRTVTIGIVQEVGDATRDAAIARAEARIREAAAQGAQVICLQELYHAPYFCKRLDPARLGLAEPVTGPVVTRMQALAAELAVVLVVPFYEREAPGLYRNSAAVIDADAALLGAEILFYPTAIGWHPAEKATFGDAQVDAWRTAQRAHAIANGVFVAAPNRVGFEAEAGTDGLEFFGQSFICDPFGRVLAQGDTAPAVLTATCDLSLIEETRRNWPFLRDRRIDAYAPITQRWLAPGAGR
jgi:N-carbamoylputrescine amidase